ncbi:SDR family oxidoreductase [Kribbia dieselivorans]|uniref:SDR family oxidoreductase n=1 Tax=Kribbia dieselivorans TaxID=331526 RepID=UPI00083840EE|nr:SDR family oxidoreductase [Kribbia dieselivorans]
MSENPGPSTTRAHDAPVAIITGASRGIGAHLADALEAAGWVVERGSTRVADVTDRSAVEGWITAVGERHGGIDLLVNNAGVIDDEVPLPDSDPDQWWRTLEINVRGPYLVTRAAFPWLQVRGGRVVNLSSGAALRPGAVASAYNVSKTALARLTGSTVAAGVAAFDVSPGVVRTDMTLAMAAHVARTEWTSPQAIVDLVRAIAAGELDAWSGRFVRAGADTVETMRSVEARLAEAERTITLLPYGEDDPLA